MAKARNYKKEYEYHGTPEQIANRASRNSARAQVEAKVGKLPTNKEVDHVKSIKKGGGNGADNLRVVSRETNRKKGSR
jgi:5-methylcytosine-specific restriction endonuclease McrA